jgi:DNA polymerase-3 subunit gamma/tau
MAELLQQMAVAQAVPDALDAGDGDEAAAARMASLLAADQTQLFYSMALHGRAELALAPDEHSGLVMVLLRMLAFGPPTGTRVVEPVAVKVQGPAQPVASAALVRAPAPARAAMQPMVPSASPHVSEPTPPPWVDAPWDDEVTTVATAVAVLAAAPVAGECIAPALPDAAFVSCEAADVIATPLGDRWTEVVQAMVQAGSIAAMVRELAMQSQCVRVDEGASPPLWVLQVERDTLRSPAQRDKLEAALALYLGTPLKLDVQAGPAQDTPAMRASAERLRRQREAEQIIADDPIVRTLMTQYSGARIVPGSVKYQ